MFTYHYVVSTSGREVLKVGYGREPAERARLYCEKYDLPPARRLSVYRMPCEASAYETEQRCHGMLKSQLGCRHWGAVSIYAPTCSLELFTAEKPWTIEGIEREAGRFLEREARLFRLGQRVVTPRLELDDIPF